MRVQDAAGQGQGGGGAGGGDGGAVVGRKGGVREEELVGCSRMLSGRAFYFPEPEVYARGRSLVGLGGG